MSRREQEVELISAILSAEDNADKTAEEIAEAILSELGKLDSYLARQDRLARQREQRERVTLAVVAQYSLDGETLHHAVLGPFGAPGEGREAAAGFSGGPAQPGSGRFMLVPAYANTREAWAAIRPSQEQRRLALALARARRESGWNPWDPKGPVCRCGVRRTDPRDAGLCPVHPERTA